MSLQFPLLTHVPDFLRPPQRGTSTAHHRLGLSTAQDTVVFPQRTPDILLSFRFSFFQRLQHQLFKEFFRERSGRTWAFFIPSWRRDITLVSPVAAGIKQIEIVSPDESYEATHLTDTDPDHYGRFLFFWKDGEDPWASDVIRVLPSSTIGQEILDLDLELPWEIDDRTVIGWCHLVRFTEDQLEWQHWSPDHAEVEVGFRATRRANQNSITQPIEQVDQYGQLGFTTCSLAPGEVLPVTNRVGYGLGPDTLHNTQDDPYRINWAVYTDVDGIVRIRKAIPPANETIWLPQVSGTESILFDGEDDLSSDHWSLAFDQNAYEVIAYQADIDLIECRRFFNTEVVTVEWEGRDPALQYNALLDANLETGDTDVICYYLKKDDNRLFMRVQRDDFDTEYVVAMLPSRPIALKRAYFEYDESEAAGVLQVEYLDAGLRVCTLSSAQYEDPPPPPIPPFILASGFDHAEPEALKITGVHVYAVRWADGGGEFDAHPPFDEGSTVTAALLGAHSEAVVYADGGELTDPHPSFGDDSETDTGVTGSHYVSVFLPEDDLSEAAETSMGLNSLTHELKVIFPPISDEHAQANASLSGVYAPI